MATLKYFDFLSQTWKYASVGQQAYVDQQIAAVRAYAPSRNKIINGDFSVNQRQFSSSSAVAYCFDRWIANHVGGCTYSAQAAALGELPESAKSFVRLLTSAQAAVTDFARIDQYIESARTLSGKTVTVSFWAKAASGTPKVAVELQQYFGTGGSPSATVYTFAGLVTLSTTWTRYSVTATLPTVVGKTFGTNENDIMGVVLFTSAGSNFAARTGSIGIQNNTIDFWGVQAEEGLVATPYEKKTYAEELRACQRYYVRYRQGGNASRYCFGVASTASEWSGLITLPVAMRTVPVFGFSGNLALSSSVALEMNPVNTPVVYTLTQQTHDVKTVSLQVSGGTGALTIYRTYFLENTTGSTSYIDFSAEL